jgi:hypothetical protein
MLLVTLFALALLPLLGYSYGANLGPREGKELFDRDLLVCGLLCVVIDQILATAIANEILACTCVQNLGNKGAEAISVFGEENTDNDAIQS